MKGSTGVSTNTVIRTPKRKRVKGKCKSCAEFRGNVCRLGRKLNPNNGCKWFSSRNDYALSKEERDKVREINKANKTGNKKVPTMEVKTVDLSKYRAYR